MYVHMQSYTGAEIYSMKAPSLLRSALNKTVAERFTGSPTHLHQLLLLLLTSSTRSTYETS